MKGLSRLILAATTTALSGAVIASIFWVTATPQGSRWLLITVPQMGGVTVSAQKIEGKIIDHLHLSKVLITLARQTIEIADLELRWKPLLLLSGTIAVQELNISGVHIQDDTPPDTKPPNLAWPKLPESAHLFDGMITQLRVSDISYRRQKEQPLRVKSIACSISWQDDLLTISELAAVTSSGHVSGTASAGFKRPSLTADLAIDLKHPVAKMDQFSLLVRRSSSTSTEPLSGHVTITGSTGKRKQLDVSGDVGMSGNSLNLRRLRLISPQRSGLITGDGTITFTAKESVVSLQIAVAALNLAPELNMPTNLCGTVNIAGTPDSYRGNFSFANKGKGWHRAALAATYHGTREGVTLAPLTGRILDGSLAGDLKMNWRKGFAIQGRINGRNLNPARINPGWKGIANFNAAGHIAWGGNAPITGSVSSSLLESTLHGQELTGELQAKYADNNLTLSRLALQGKGFDLQASGSLEQRLTLATRISDLSGLVPGSTGTVRGDGWVRWHDHQLSGAVNGTGNALAYTGTQVAAATVTARLDQGEGYPGQIAVSLRDIVHSQYRLKTVEVAADGKLARHDVRATVQSDSSEVQMKLIGGYNAYNWQGAITQLTGSGSAGLWELAAPAPFALSSTKLSLTRLSLTAGTTVRLEVDADLRLKPLTGKLQAQWSGIDSALFKPWLPGDSTIEGMISGRAHGILLPGNRFELDGTASLAGGALHRGEMNLTFTSADASWKWHNEKLSGTLALNTAPYGQTGAHFTLPIPARFPVAVTPQLPLQGAINGHFQEQGILSTLFPEYVQKSFGSIDVAVAVGGTWEAPLIGGTLKMAKAGAYLPTTGITLKEVQLSAYLEKNRIRIDPFRVVSGPGHIEGNTLITLDGWRVAGYQGVINGENFQTVYLPELRIMSSPQFSFEGTPQKLTLRGELRIPELQFDGAQTWTVISPSKDVITEGIIVPLAARSPFIVDGQIRVLIGERVFAKVAGIDAQLGGGMDLTFNSLDNITSRGEITVVKGHYRTYGVDLEIIRGRLFFAGGPIDQPSLDFLALRTVGDVKAGVTVAGSIQKPMIKLYAEPTMPDVDILAYIVLGHPYASDGEQAGLMTKAAGALLTTGQASELQDQLKNQFGLSTLEIQGGVGAPGGSMGYKPLQSTVPGALPSALKSGATDTVLTVGKYLTPQLYISYGKSLFTGTNLFLLRYDIFKQWQIETQTGSESGADLFYKMEFK